MLYLVLPQTQGAKVLYLDYLEPYIVHHESQIDDFITQVHAQLQGVGLGYVNYLIEFIREKVLRQQSPQPPAQQTGAGSYASYTNDFLSRFLMPQARPSESQPVGGIYSALSGFAASAMAGGAAGAAGSSRGRGGDSDLDSGLSSRLRELQDPGQKQHLLSSERERLMARLKQLDSEQQNIDLAYGSSGAGGSGGMSKSRSDASFVNVGHDDFQPPPPVAGSHSNAGSRQTSGSGWGQAASAAAGFFADSDRSKSSGAKESSGWSAARDITAAISSGLDRAGNDGERRR